ncbi:unnamed protein product [Discula destructiva]
MAWRSSGTSNEDLVAQLWKNGLITDERVRDAFLKVDRAHYAPRSAYADHPQPIGHAATISAPHMHAAAVEHLLPLLLPSSSSTPQPPTRRVLDIGSGSGYLTHILAALLPASPTRTVVVGLEHILALRDLGEANMRKSTAGREMLASGRVRFVVGDGRKGWVEPPAAPSTDGAETKNGEEYGGWDVIHVGAAAATMHPELVAQLRRPGRMFIPVADEDGGAGGQSVWVVDKDAEGRVEKRRLFGVRYVPLTDAPPVG